MPNPENFKEYEVYSNAEWAENPTVYITDVEFYRDLIIKGREAMNSVGATGISFNLVGEPQGAGFLVDIEEFQDVRDATNEYTLHDGTKCPAVIRHGMDFEIPWTSPLLKLTTISTRLVWYAKHSDEECWIDLE
jgi:hypothetical protein